MVDHDIGKRSDGDIVVDISLSGIYMVDHGIRNEVTVTLFWIDSTWYIYMYIYAW